MNTLKHLFSLPLLALTITAAHAQDSAQIPVPEIRQFVEVYNIIRHEYVEKKDGKQLIDFAIEGMVEHLDPHSDVLEKEDLEDLDKDANGHYKGFGFQLDVIAGELVVIAPIKGSPAAKAGIKANDHIVKIDDVVIKDMSMHAVSKLLDAYETVTMTIYRGNEAPHSVELTKSTVILPNVSHEVLETGYGYVSIAQFQLDTAEQVEKALNELTAQQIKGIVLDLRNNPGGLISAAIDTADLFLNDGIIVSTKNKNTGFEEKFHADAETPFKELPIVVLINEGSASAAELLAGALQDNRRALVVGRVSFGKGSVQTVMPLGHERAIKLTTSLYYTPKGVSIQAKGITPDIILKQLTVQNATKDNFDFGEANIPNHLATDTTLSSDEGRHTDYDSNTVSVVAADDHTDTDVVSDETAAELATTDLQLFEALNALKVLVFTLP